MKRFCTLTLSLPLFMSSGVSAQMQWTTDTIISTGFNTSGIAITPDNSKVVFTIKSSPGLVKIMSTASRTIATIDVSAQDNYPDAVAIAPNGTLALVCGAHKVIFINLLTNAVMGSYAPPCVGNSLYGIAIKADNSTAYFPDLTPGCTGQGLRTISPLAPGATSTFTNIATSGQLYGIALNNAGTSALITGFSSGGVPRNYNLATGSTQNITGVTSSYGVACFHNSNEALLFDGDSLVRVSLSTNSVVKRIAYVSYNTAIQTIYITPDDKYAFVMGSFEKRVIDLTNNSIIQTFGSGGTSVVAKSDASEFYVTEYGNGNLRVYQPTSISGIRGNRRDDKRLDLFPNPAAGKVTIRCNEPGIAGKFIEVYDCRGTRVFCAQIAEAMQTLDLSGLSKGLYYYNVGGADNALTGKLLID